MAAKKKIRETVDEGHDFKSEWIESFWFIVKSNAETHFQIKHGSFATTYPI